MNTVERLKQAARRLSAACDEAIAGLEASGAVAHATNPLDYAWAHHEQFLDQWGGLGATTLLLHRRHKRRPYLVPLSHICRSRLGLLVSSVP